MGAALAIAGCDDDGRVIGAGPRARVTRPFSGSHQVGIAEPSAAFGLMAAFRCVDPDRASLARTFEALSAEARRLVDGRPPPQRSREMPPADTGVLGADEVRPRVTVAVGASMFDHRFGLASRRPREMVPMPFLANDRLDPAPHAR
jgi:deferrochelatase/peroxidase EfeB